MSWNWWNWIPDPPQADPQADPPPADPPQADPQGHPRSKIHIKLQSGWEKTSITNENGEVELTLIRDYFPPWNKFEKRFKQDLLITLEHDIENTKYTLTYPASFYPNSSDYESYAYALLLITLTLLISGIVIYRFRKNRTKPFSEVKFDE